jgi:hypothetical protein
MLAGGKLLSNFCFCTDTYVLTVPFKVVLVDQYKKAPKRIAGSMGIFFIQKSQKVKKLKKFQNKVIKRLFSITNKHLYFHHHQQQQQQQQILMISGGLFVRSDSMSSVDSNCSAHSSISRSQCYKTLTIRRQFNSNSNTIDQYEFSI